MIQNNMDKELQNLLNALKDLREDLTRSVDKLEEIFPKYPEAFISDKEEEINENN